MGFALAVFVFILHLAPFLLGAVPFDAPALRAAYLAAGLHPVLWCWHRATRAKWAIFFAVFYGTLSGADLLMRPWAEAEYGLAAETRAHTEVLGLHRFRPNLNVWAGVRGDLARMLPRAEFYPKRRIHLQTDTLGFRNGPGASRGVEILLLGDSFVSGVGVSQEHIWSSVLTDRYKRPTYAFGSHGFGDPWSELIDFKLTVDRLELKPGAVLVWALFTGNDLAVVPMPTEPVRLTFFQSQVLRLTTFQRGSPIGRFVARLRGKYVPRGAGEKVFSRRFLGKELLFYRDYMEGDRFSADVYRSGPNYPPLKEVFVEMAREAAERGIRVVVMVLPTKERIYGPLADEDPLPAPAGDPFADIIVQLSRENGFAFVDLKEAFASEAGRLKEAGEGGLLWLEDDTHWAPAGHALAAKMTHEILGSFMLDSQGIERPEPIRRGA